MKIIGPVAEDLKEKPLACSIIAPHSFFGAQKQARAVWVGTAWRGVRPCWSLDPAAPGFSAPYAANGERRSRSFSTARDPMTSRCLSPMGEGQEIWKYLPADIPPRLKKRLLLMARRWQVKKQREISGGEK